MFNHISHIMQTQRNISTNGNNKMLTQHINIIVAIICIRTIRLKKKYHITYNFYLSHIYLRIHYCKNGLIVSIIKSFNAIKAEVLNMLI